MLVDPWGKQEHHSSCRLAGGITYHEWDIGEIFTEVWISQFCFVSIRCWPSGNFGSTCADDGCQNRGGNCQAL